MGAVWRKAWRGDPTVDDSGEMLSYRVAFFGFLASLLFVGVWLWASGVPLAILPLFLLMCLIFYVFVTRAVATAGLATARSPMVAAFFRHFRGRRTGDWSQGADGPDIYLRLAVRDAALSDDRRGQFAQAGRGGGWF